jgi:hypothetical protein
MAHSKWWVRGGALPQLRRLSRARNLFAGGAAWAIKEPDDPVMKWSNLISAHDANKTATHHRGDSSGPGGTSEKRFPGSAGNNVKMRDLMNLSWTRTKTSRYESRMGCHRSFH